MFPTRSTTALLYDYSLPGGTHGSSASTSVNTPTWPRSAQALLVPALRQSHKTLKKISVFAILYLSLFTARVPAAFPGNGTLCCSAASKGQPSFPQQFCSGRFATYLFNTRHLETLLTGFGARFACWWLYFIMHHVIISSQASWFVWCFPGHAERGCWFCSEDSARRQPCAIASPQSGSIGGSGPAPRSPHRREKAPPNNHRLGADVLNRKDLFSHCLFSAMLQPTYTVCSQDSPALINYHLVVFFFAISKQYN